MIKKVFFVVLYAIVAILTFNNQMMSAMYLMAGGMLLEACLSLLNNFLETKK